MREKRSGAWAQRWRVPLGFMCGAITLLLARPRVSTLVVGGFIALLGLALRAWSAGHIRKNRELTMTGPYAYTRNPLYLGSLLLGAGFLIAAANPYLVVLFVVLFAGIYLPVMRVEAGDLAKVFGAEYQAYEHAVPLLIPRLTPYRAAGATNDAKVAKVGFDKNLYLRYREYQAAMGLVFALAILVFKMFYFA